MTYSDFLLPTIEEIISGKALDIADLTAGYVIPSKFAQEQYTTTYTIKTGDTPEKIAFALYGNMNLSWIITKFTGLDITSWPYDATLQTNQISDQFQGQTIYFKPTISLNNMITSPSITASSLCVYFKPGDTIVTNSSAVAQVLNWNPSLLALAITQPTLPITAGNTAIGCVVESLDFYYPDETITTSSSSTLDFFVSGISGWAGQLQKATPSSVVLDTLASTKDDYYITLKLWLIDNISSSSAVLSQSRIITGYNGTTKEAFLDENLNPVPTIVSLGSSYQTSLGSLTNLFSSSGLNYLNEYIIETGKADPRNNFYISSSAIARVQPSTAYALHHFTDITGSNYLSPYQLTSSSTTLIQEYINNTLSNTVAVAVTNMDHLQTSNEINRNIRVIRPEYISMLLSDIQNWLKNRKTILES